MTLYEYLSCRAEDSPVWLGNFHCGDPFPREQFFASRVVYYPGSGTDGHPVKLFGSTHSAHCFVYADYGLSQQRLESTLADCRLGFRGYHTFARLQLRESDLVPNGWTPHVHSGEVPSTRTPFASVSSSPFGFLEILERDEHLSDEHGARRLAILFLGADAIAAYDALFCQGNGIAPPFAVLLQDHGFGGNYDRFGQNSLLERIASRCNVLPPFLLVAEDTEAWHSFEQMPEVDGDRGGMHNTLRTIYERRQ